MCLAHNKSEKIKTAERIALPNQKSIKTFREKENYKYSEILEEDTIKQTEIKEITTHMVWSGHTVCTSDNRQLKQLLHDQLYAA